MTNVSVRRQWNDWNLATVDIEKLDGWHWSQVSGGVRAFSPHPFVHAYTWCTDIKGDIAHSGLHGPCPHWIKVVIVKKDNLKIWGQILEKAGPKPKQVSRKQVF